MTLRDQPPERKELKPGDPVNALPTSAKQRLIYGMEGHERPPPGQKKR